MHTTEFSGEGYGFSLVYSGNFLVQEVDTFNVSRVSMRIHPHCFNWMLGCNETFDTPDVAMVYSDTGLNTMI